MSQESTVLYTANAQVTGGRAGVAEISGHTSKIKLVPPSAEAPSPDGFNPEQLFAVGYAACFASAVNGTARRKGTPVTDVRIDSSVELRQSKTSSAYFLNVGLVVHMSGLSNDEAEQLVQEVHERVCPYSAAIKGNVDVAIRVVVPSLP